MSDTANPMDAAIELLRERERQMDSEILVLTARRDGIRESIATLTSRKPRAPRKPRPIGETAPAEEEGRPTLFAPPRDADAAEAA